MTSDVFLKVDTRACSLGGAALLPRLRAASWKPPVQRGEEAAVHAKVAEKQQNVCVRSRVGHGQFLQQVSLSIYVAGMCPL